MQVDQDQERHAESVRRWLQAHGYRVDGRGYVPNELRGLARRAGIDARALPETRTTIRRRR